MWPRRPNIRLWPVRKIHGSALTAYAQDTGVPNKFAIDFTSDIARAFSRILTDTITRISRSRLL